MYLAYIDESGKANYKDTEQECVLTAVLINEKDWIIANQKMNEIKGAVWKSMYSTLPIPIDFEIHTSQIISGRSYFRKIPNREDRVKILNILLDHITNINFKVITVCILKNKLRKTIPLEEWLLRLLVERIDQITNEEFSLLVYDSENSKYDMIRQKYIENFLDQGTYYHKFTRIIESPFFAKSHMRVCICYPDLIGYVIRRYIRQINSPSSLGLFDPYIPGMMEKIIPKFHRAKNLIYGKPDTFIGTGLKIFPDCPQSAQIYSELQKLGKEE